MVRFASLPLGLFLASCSSPVLFAVEVDEPIKGGVLTLNGKSAKLMRNIDGRFWAKWDGSDADGSVDVTFVDGASASCRVGYVTNGMTDVQAFRIIARRCEPVI